MKYYKPMWKRNLNNVTQTDISESLNDNTSFKHEERKPV
jgi:hypothetical protein